MEQKIAEVQQYFINKLATADFDIVRGGLFILWVLIDGKYKFCLWIGSGVTFFHPYNSYESFIKLPEFNEIIQAKLYAKLKSEILQYTDPKERQKEIKNQINALRNELKSIKKP